jgi:hypothetical protein
MSLAVLDLNDHELGLYDNSGLIIASPGYVLAQGKHTVFGQNAAQQSRLHPVSINNEFWYRLGMAPLSRPLANFRHYADIAYGHLLHLAEQSDYKGDVVLSVPASFSREQLAILSGVIRHSPFKPVAMVDAALASLLALPGLDQLVYVDLQLHQLSLTRLTIKDEQVRRDAFITVSGAGWIHLANTIVQVVTDAFVTQSRFNPQHRADWEQSLYNQLPDWLQQFKLGQSEIVAQIQTENSLVQARVSLNDVLEALGTAFHKISQQLEQLMQNQDAACDITLSARAAMIPGLQSCLQASVHSVPGEQLAMLCLQALPQSLSSSAEAIPMLTALTLKVSAPVGIGATLQQPLKRQPTHLLWQAQAWPLPVAVKVDTDGQCEILESSDDADVVFSIREKDGQAQLLTRQPDIRVAGKLVNGSHPVYAGDNIRLGSPAVELHCIRVIS